MGLVPWEWAWARARVWAWSCPVMTSRAQQLLCRCRLLSDRCLERRRRPMPRHPLARLRGSVLLSDGSCGSLLGATGRRPASCPSQWPRSSGSSTADGGGPRSQPCVVGRRRWLSSRSGSVVVAAAGPAAPLEGSVEVGGRQQMVAGSSGPGGQSSMAANVAGGRQCVRRRWTPWSSAVVDRSAVRWSKAICGRTLWWMMTLDLEGGGRVVVRSWWGVQGTL